MKDKKKINFAAIITVRTSSSRLPKKCHQKLFKDLSLIEIVIDRAKKIEKLAKNFPKALKNVRKD